MEAQGAFGLVSSLEYPHARMWPLRLGSGWQRSSCSPHGQIIHAARVTLKARRLKVRQFLGKAARHCNRGASTPAFQFDMTKCISCHCCEAARNKAKQKSAGISRVMSYLMHDVLPIGANSGSQATSSRPKIENISTFWVPLAHRESPTTPRLDYTGCSIYLLKQIRFL